MPSIDTLRNSMRLTNSTYMHTNGVLNKDPPSQEHTWGEMEACLGVREVTDNLMEWTMREMSQVLMEMQEMRHP